MPYIEKNFINDLLNRVDIVDVINSYVPLKKQGKEFGACCPFHNEKTPSFTVNSDKQFYHCFGCGANGNAIGFLMNLQNLDFVESVETLASQNGLSVIYKTNNSNNYATKSKTEPIFEILDKANQWFRQQLKSNPNKDLAIDYLKKRQLNPQIVDKFQIGYAPNNGLIDALSDDGKNINLLLKAGLINQDENNEFYDKFRERLLFPIFDFKNRVIGFGGRTLINHKAKYYNSPTTEVFHKGKELYALNQSKKNIKDKTMALIVEGYMDVVSLAQFDVDYAVASLGTSTTFEQLKTLFKSTNKIICCYDGDNAGVKAAIKVMHEVLPLIRAGRTLKFMFLPRGEDPDTFIRKNGKEKFEQLIKRAHPFDEFVFRYLQKGLDLRKIDDRSLMLKNAIEVFKFLPDNEYRDFIIKDLADILKMKEEEIKIKINNSPLEIVKKPIQNQITNKQQVLYTSALKAISFLIKNPSLAKNIEFTKIFYESKHPTIIFLIELVNLIKKNPEINTNILLEDIKNIKNHQLIIKKSLAYESLIDNLPDEVIMKGLDDYIKETEKNIKKAKQNVQYLKFLEESQKLKK